MGDSVGVRFYSTVSLSKANLSKSSEHKSVAAGMEILLWVGQQIQDRKIARNSRCFELVKYG